MTAGVKQSLVPQRGGAVGTTAPKLTSCYAHAGIFHVEMGKATKPNMHAMLKLVPFWSP